MNGGRRFVLLLSLVELLALRGAFAVGADAAAPLDRMRKLFEERTVGEILDSPEAEWRIELGDVETVRRLVWDSFLRECRADPVRQKEHETQEIHHGDATMRYASSRIGEKPEGGYPLYIALHGGGGAPSRLNDSQWRHMAVYYRESVKSGIYVAARGVSDTWNLHFRGESYPLYDRLIENLIVFEDVDPNRVYLLGYSAGGDGVYQIVPRMADRFAAANMSAGHHNGTSPANLCNVPFLLQVGELDAAYRRNEETVRYWLKLEALREANPEGYVHELFVHRGRPHNFRDNDPAETEQDVIDDPRAWLETKERRAVSRNTNAIAWLRKYARNPRPTRVVWDVKTFTDRRAASGDGGGAKSGVHKGAQRYWLDLDGEAPGSLGVDTIVARLDESQNAVVVESAGKYLRILLRQGMLDLSRPVKIILGSTVFRFDARPNLGTMIRTVLERGDPELVFDAECTLRENEGVWTLDAGAASAGSPEVGTLELDAPIQRWDEAVPLGNGLIGGLLWGEDRTLRFSLDRGDLWDERVPDMLLRDDWTWATIRRLVREKDHGRLVEMFDRPYDAIPYPTKLPAGRLELDLAESATIDSFTLDLESAQGRARLENGATVSGFVSARRPVAVLRLPAGSLKGFRLLPPASVKRLGYPDPEIGSDGSTRWFVEEAAQGLRFAVVAATRDESGETLLAVTVAADRGEASHEGKAPWLAEAKRNVVSALDVGYAGLLQEHLGYWREFWSRSSVTVPEVEIQRHYNLVQYLYGSGSRPGAPPLPLQGVWTADEGNLPPWKGDYHHDLNTQMTYLAYATAGHFEEGRSFLDFMFERLPRFREFARRFYDAPGAAVPGVMSLAGQPLGGWGMYSLSPTNGAWVGHLFYLHWRYTQDEGFLRTRAYPWCAEIGECLLHLLEEDENGVLKLPLSSSPEIFDNSLRAWLTPNSNYDHDCMQMLFVALAEMAKAQGKDAESERWSRASKGLGERSVDADGVLMFSAKDPVSQSHRHLSHSMSIHPFNLLHVEGGDDARRTIDATLRRYDSLGTRAWCGYSFSWMSCLRARAGDAEAALRNLEVFVKAFILRNGFHVNGDQLRAGFSDFTYRPFTLEGNFLAAEAVHEMLLQSWSPRPGAPNDFVVRVFPATAWRWHEASFDRLRSEGGYLVSARRESNATTWVRIEATRSGVVRLRDNFAGRVPTWSSGTPEKVGEDFRISLQAGESIEARFPKPTTVPEPPADVARPLVIPRFIQPNTLPLRIGADSNGENRFRGDIARASVFGRALSAEEVGRLARSEEIAPSELAGSVVTWSFQELDDGSFRSSGSVSLTARVVETVAVVDSGSPLGSAVRLDGSGYLEVAHASELDCLDGLTLEAWIRPLEQGPSGGRILDKSPVGAATAYLLDTYPGNSLRLIFRDPHLGFDAKLPVGEWVHVAATVDGTTGRSALYVDGRRVAEQ